MYNIKLLKLSTKKQYLHQKMNVSTRINTQESQISVHSHIIMKIATNKYIFFSHRSDMDTPLSLTALYIINGQRCEISTVRSIII